MDWYRTGTRLLGMLPAERAHDLALDLLAGGWLGMDASAEIPATLESERFGIRFASPIGIAAGFDKNARALDGLYDLGVGFAEVGCVTPRPQPGNDRPRLFRDRGSRAVINRFGFNNDGLDVIAGRIETWRRTGRHRDRPLAVNLGMNKGATDPAADYAVLIRRLAPLADMLTVNVSSPNTPGLRALQAADLLRPILEAALEARASSGRTPALLVKVAPDLDADQTQALVGLILDLAGGPDRAGIDGLIVSNTTLSRPDHLPARFAAEAGGLSGRPLKDRAAAALRQFASLLDGRIGLVAAGGIETADDVADRLASGADLVQIYSALVYEGPGLIRRLNRELAAGYTGN